MRSKNKAIILGIKEFLEYFYFNFLRKFKINKNPKNIRLIISNKRVKI